MKIFKTDSYKYQDSPISNDSELIKQKINISNINSIDKGMLWAMARKNYKDNKMIGLKAMEIFYSTYNGGHNDSRAILFWLYYTKIFVLHLSPNALLKVIKICEFMKFNRFSVALQIWRLASFKV
jgi:hypothetical protein